MRWDLVGSNSCCICMWFHFIMDSHSKWLWIPSSWLCSVGRSLTAHAILPGRKSLESRWGGGWYRIAPWQLGDYVRLACNCFRMMAHRTRHYEKMPSYIASAFIGRYGSFDDTSSCGGLAAAFVSLTLRYVWYSITSRYALWRRNSNISVFKHLGRFFAKTLLFLLFILKFHLQENFRIILTNFRTKFQISKKNRLDWMERISPSQSLIVKASRQRQ